MIKFLYDFIHFALSNGFWIFIGSILFTGVFLNYSIEFIKTLSYLFISVIHGHSPIHEEPEEKEKENKEDSNNRVSFK